MERDELLHALQSLGRTMRLVALNMDSDRTSTAVLIPALTELRNLIDVIIPHLPDNELLAISTRLGPAVEDLIAADFPDVPDYPPEL